MRIGDALINPSDTVRDLGVLFYQYGTMKPHVNEVCRKASAALWRIGKIRSLLDQKTTERLIHAFVTSRLDYCNSLLFGLNDCLLSRLQLIQNSAMRLVTLSRKFDHITPILADFHWLPVSEPIKFKIVLTTFKILNEQAPAYLTELVSLYQPSRVLRSSDNKLTLNIIRTRTSYGSRAFSSAAPLLWNGLPENIRLAENVTNFKKLLNTYLFKKLFF